MIFIVINTIFIFIIDFNYIIIIIINFIFLFSFWLFITFFIFFLVLFIFDIIHNFIGKTEQEILDDIAVGGGFSWVKRRLEQPEYEAVRALIREKDYAGCLGFRDEAKRYYPNDVLAANVIGFVGTDDKGLDGIEQALDKYIKGEVTDTFLYTDPAERPILDSIFAKRGYQGDHCKTIELTIDSAIQFIVEQELDKAMAANNPLSVTCVVMDPKTAEVLAMASRPSYNPNRFWDYQPEVWKTWE